MLEQVLRYLKNWFVVPGGVDIDGFSIEGGSLELPFLAEGQYFRIVGSIFNDGVYKYPAENLNDEAFNGAVWALAVPPAVVALADEIAAWQAKNGDAATSPYQSESFGGYSYSRASDSETGGAVTWQTAFSGRLAQWRKI